MAELLKNQFFTRQFITELSQLIVLHYPQFSVDKFMDLVFDDDWENKELKARMRHTTLSLNKMLPLDYPETINILMKVAPEIEGFNAMIFPDYVEIYGLNHWDLSFKALELFTQSFSSEFGVRPFIKKDTKKAMEHLYLWAKSENEHVRRLASEGCRPMLPWATALPEFKKDPTPILPVLEELKNDTSLYVRKSVANNLNDISKNQPALVLSICERWKGYSSHTNWIIKHACRTLLKAGNTQAMRLFGFSDPGFIEIKEFSVYPTAIKIGDSMEIRLKVHSKKEKKNVRIEYVIYYQTKSGKLSPKVFQLKECILNDGVTSFKKKHSFAVQSTRKLYPGEHRIEIKVNGEVKKFAIFELITHSEKP